ncbi:16S rRNA (guanine(966)-N(2))-methyltransferase RsmD [Alkalispirochaeta americana]|uniref:16S rRNA (Guanine(966)-N(2))-methyltransferase RsmD n=1 Tax=Alkalispirochaeta americana TaxID=159291 RepID=A0A1N6WHW4_9SPIO|nr:16S rRNA (guanine(966)-N(2))-methyltransferase RsmD [Alkalispirochaeta americana]SIQ89703.1 16S rRNA (guanine(966)-N(2))-methyltransferase RsmD [Alkalispirochaeta americana]
MRISGGTLRGRTVLCPPGVIRPAMDRMRESLFSILGPLQGLSFLDLFSGSGLVGLEAYSRGAQPVVLVEKDRGKRRVILKNLADLPSPPRLCLEPVERYVARTSTPFDIVYLDPPFSYPYKEDLLLRISRSRLIREETRILIHLPTEEALPDQLGRLERDDRREYGGSSVHFFSPSSPGNADT